MLSFIPKTFKLCILTLSRFFSNFRRGTGFLSKLNMPSERGCVEIYGVFTNNHVLGSINEAEKAHATFGYEGSEEGQQVKLKPEKMFRTNKVSAVCACEQCAVQFYNEAS